jgi:H-type small acid-soluble spore protein
LNMARAKEIFVSRDTIRVLYQGSSVWIESLQEKSGSAEVTVLNSRERLKVPVARLVE